MSMQIFHSYPATTALALGAVSFASQLAVARASPLVDKVVRMAARLFKRPEDRTIAFCRAYQEMERNLLALREAIGKMKPDSDIVVQLPVYNYNSGRLLTPGRITINGELFKGEGGVRNEPGICSSMRPDQLRDRLIADIHYISLANPTRTINYLKWF